LFFEVTRRRNSATVRGDGKLARSVNAELTKHAKRTPYDAALQHSPSSLNVKWFGASNRDEQPFPPAAGVHKSTGFLPLPPAFRV